ncbi:Metallo-dependent phosphatase-like protein [Fennellomyces sp. T-0311]|nr:Metallo-dependent phosphatase-like protein [Fennellomyces sp. T-0311]
MIVPTDAVEHLPAKEPHRTRFVCVSDTHGRTDFKFPIPAGDVLGDLTRVSRPEEFTQTIDWLQSLPHTIKIVTGGNHDHDLDLDIGGSPQHKQHILAKMEQAGITYLEHESFRLPEALGGHKMFVSPYAPFHLGGAFMPTKHTLRQRWNEIPDDTEILVTHTPPHGYQDKIAWGGRHVGCPMLMSKILHIRPRVCISGHIHEAHGWSYTDDRQTLIINACICDRKYRTSQRPIVFDL